MNQPSNTPWILQDELTTHMRSVDYVFCCLQKKSTSTFVPLLTTMITKKINKSNKQYYIL